MNNVKKAVLHTIAVFWLLILTGCSSTPLKATNIDGANLYGPQADNAITMVPLIDLRPDKTIKFDQNAIEKYMLTDRFANSFLEITGHPFAYYTSYGIAGEISEGDLTDLDKEKLKKIGPPTAKRVLLIELNDINLQHSFGKAISGTCTGLLIDRPSGKVVWQKHNVYEEGHGGLAGMMIPDETYISGAVKQCMFQLMHELKGAPSSKSELQPIP